MTDVTLTGTFRHVSAILTLLVSDKKQHKKTRSLMKRLAQKTEIIVTAAYDQIQESFKGIAGDIAGLQTQVEGAKASAEEARAAAADLKQKLDVALSDQEPAIQERIKAAVAESTANLENANRTLQSQLAQVAEQAAQLDARVPAVVATPDPDEVPVETPNVPETDTEPSNPVPAPETPAEEPVENGDDSVPPPADETFPGTQEPQIDPQAPTEDDEFKPLPVTP